jgi:hypothetical protein
MEYGGTMRTTVKVFIAAVVLLVSGDWVEGQPPPDVEKALVQTVRSINRAFIRGDLQTLDALTHKELTMLHGHMKRTENKEQAMTEWKKLFADRDSAGISYFIKESDFKVQLYGGGNVAIVTFSYEHPIVLAGKVGTEGGKAIYVLLLEGGRWQMVHCSTIRDERAVPGHAHAMP